MTITPGHSPISPHGLIETVKRSVMTALMSVLDEYFPDEELKKVKGNISMEYPIKEVMFPGIWVQFSLTDVGRAGLEPVHESPDGSQFWMGEFKGRVTLTVVSLSSLERDRISDALVQVLLFDEVYPEADSFFENLREDDFASITVAPGTMRATGQGTTFGTPWGTDEMTYEDGFTLDIVGQFASQYGRTGLYRLSEIRVSHTNISEPLNPVTKSFTVPSPGEWV